MQSPRSCARPEEHESRKGKLIETPAKMGVYFLKAEDPERNRLGKRGRGPVGGLILPPTKDKGLSLQGMQNLIARTKKKGLIIKTMGHALEFAPSYYPEEGLPSRSNLENVSREGKGDGSFIGWRLRDENKIPDKSLTTFFREDSKNPSPERSTSRSKG